MEIFELYKIYKSHPIVCTDSRNIIPNSIFFALKGEKFDGHTFVENAFEKGCAYCIIDDEHYKINEKCILVPDVLTTLQEIAKYHRKQLSIPFIGITGSNGKTTTKELVNSVLSSTFKTLCTQGNLNNHIGVPLTLLSITKDIEVAIIEMGANHPGEIKQLAHIADPDLGIITNIGKAHIEGFGSFEGVINTKKELYDHIKAKKGKIFLNPYNEILHNISDGIENVTYVKGNTISSSPFLEMEWNTNKIKTQLVGKYNAENVLCAITVGKYFNIPDLKIITSIENYTPKNNRSQCIQKGSNTIIMDAYNANPSSMEASILNFSEIAAQKKVLFIGDMLELGNISESEHTKIIELIKKLNFDNVFLTGKMFSLCNKENKFKTFPDVNELIKSIEKENISDSFILIKASRGVSLEKILDYL